MKNILDRGNNLCCSCGVCAVVCPINCITITRNKEGFYRPVVDEAKCTNCGLCQKVCYQYLETSEPFTNYFKDKEIYAAWSKSKETVNSSSSGGICHELLTNAISCKYNAVGVVYDTKTSTCKHVLAKTPHQLEKIKGSKYLQSYTVEAFNDFKKNEKYIVVGTPCQIYGLRQWIKLKHWEDNFILIDFFCHGTPSSLLWKSYQAYLEKYHNIPFDFDVNFRDKSKNEWHLYDMSISHGTTNKEFRKSHSKDLFFQLFLKNTCLNDSCNNCLLRLDTCYSDIRLGDFWGPQYADNKSGVTLVTINSNKGKSFFQKIQKNIFCKKHNFAEFCSSQPTRFISHFEKKETVISLLINSVPIDKIYKMNLKRSIFTRVANKILRIIFKKSLY